MLQKINKIKKNTISIWLSWTITALMLFPLKNRASGTERIVISPMTVLGEIPVPEQQILFNHFRDQINQHYSLVSYKVLEMITNQEESIDIEKCKNSNCARQIKNFINRISWQFKVDNLFLFGLIKSEKTTQLTLKLTSLSVPELTKKIATRTCHECGIEALLGEVDMLVKKMLQKIADNKFIYPEEKVAFPEDNFPKNKEKPEKKVASPKDMLPEVTEEKPDPTPEPPPPDPYNLARDAYNQQIGKLLVNVTYSLQVFRSGMFVKLEVTIDQKGNVVNQKIIKSSGSQDFDQTAILNVQEIQFDSLPEEMKKFGNYVVILQIQNSR